MTNIAAANNPMTPPAPLRLTLDGNALVGNWRWLAKQSGRAACGAAIKADSYGLGARAVLTKLYQAGCRDFFVSSWDEAAALGDWPDDASLAVLHGLRPVDLPRALAFNARPVLNSPEQIALWQAAGNGRPCDVMIDTGINRLGLTPAEARTGLLDGLNIDTLLSHLACADEPAHPMNEQQLFAFRGMLGVAQAKRLSLANSAGIMLGPRYAFNLTRPGLALYGGISVPDMAEQIKPVASLAAEVIQVRQLSAGDTVGYGATFTAPAAMRTAIVHVGYADGYWRHFAGTGGVYHADQQLLPLVGRVSMDMIAVDLLDKTVQPGDWLTLDFDLPRAAADTGFSQYELLTGLGQRFERLWV
jgi:alanine racemase